MTDSSIFDSTTTSSTAQFVLTLFTYPMAIRLTSPHSKAPSASTSVPSAPPDVDNRTSAADTRDKVAEGVEKSGGMGQKIKGVFGKGGQSVEGEQKERHEQANRDLNRE